MSIFTTTQTKGEIDAGGVHLQVEQEADGDGRTPLEDDRGDGTSQEHGHETRHRPGRSRLMYWRLVASRREVNKLGDRMVANRQGGVSGLQKFVLL